MAEDWRGMTEPEFGALLNEYLHPSSPIRQAEFLRGREGQLRTIREALSLTGRSVFIYGDRGVGKTSLALTSAAAYQQSGKAPVLSGCAGDATAYEVVRDVARRLLGEFPIKERKTITRQYGAEKWGLSGQHITAIEQGEVETPTTVNEAVALLQFAGAAHSRKPIAIIDEFDRLEKSKDRGLFGDIIKQLADQGVENGVGIKLVFSGVGDSVDDLLAGHASASRYLASVPLERLQPQPLLDIMKKASDAILIPVSQNRLFRIAAISDGFPHYVHLLGTKFFWRAYHNYRAVAGERRDEGPLFDLALLDAVGEVDAALRRSYDKAVRKYRGADHYQFILWALASHHDLLRSSALVYKVYEGIAQKMNVEPLERKYFNSRFNVLKRDAYGKIVRATRQGWYRFNEPIMRGYCRLQAQLRGLELGPDYPF